MGYLDGMSQLEERAAEGKAGGMGAEDAAIGSEDATVHDVSDAMESEDCPPPAIATSTLSDGGGDAIGRAIASEALVFIMNTPETSPFFLAHRELFQPKHNLGGGTDSLAALPWLLCGKAMNTVPSSWERCCKKDYIVRLCLNNQTPSFTCPVCHEERCFADNPCQLCVTRTSKVGRCAGAAGAHA